MNEQIDWSKAPADATHYHPRAGGYVEHWIKPGFFCVTDFEHKGWQATPTDALKMAVPRPLPVANPWDGPDDGLPPVGTICELRSRNGGWGEAEIKYHGRAVCVWLWVRRDGNTEQIEHAESPDRLEFRPIRTAEQLAAEERERQVNLMGDITAPLINRYVIAERLYDAGVRMPGEGSKS